MSKIKITSDTYISGQPISAGSIVETDEATANLLKGYKKGEDATAEDVAAADKANKKVKIEGKEAK